MQIPPLLQSLIASVYQTDIRGDDLRLLLQYREQIDFAGVELSYRIFGTHSISVEVGTLDKPELSPPEYHICTENQIPWFALDDELPRS